MQYKKPTVFFIVFVTALIVVYDVWALTRGYEWTISSTLLEASKRWPVIPFLLGLLAGHLFFPNRAAGAIPDPEDKK